MIKMVALLWTGLLLNIATTVVGKIFTTQQVPVITDIEPHFGGIEGGTRITISGINFNSPSLFTKTRVYFGNSLANECETIDHYSGDTQLVCLTPKCRTETCRNGECMLCVGCVCMFACICV